MKNNEYKMKGASLTKRSSNSFVHPQMGQSISNTYISVYALGHYELKCIIVLSKFKPHTIQTMTYKTTIQSIDPTQIAQQHHHSKNQIKTNQEYLFF